MAIRVETTQTIQRYGIKLGILPSTSQPLNLLQQERVLTFCDTQFALDLVAMLAQLCDEFQRLGEIEPQLLDDAIDGNQAAFDVAAL
jgi:hypothetical protein